MTDIHAEIERLTADHAALLDTCALQTAEIRALGEQVTALTAERDALAERAKSDSIALSAIVGMLSDPAYVPCEAEVRHLGTVRELVDRVRAERDAAQADAKRYRWLKSRNGLTLRSEKQPNTWTRMDGTKFSASHSLSADGTQYAPAATLDELIDAAAIAAERQK